MDRETLIKILDYSKSEKISEKEACIKIVGKEIKLYYYKKKYSLLSGFTTGTNPNSKKKREHIVDDNFFSFPSELNCYYGGFIAADGNIKKDFNLLTIGISSKDRNWLERFLSYLKSDYSIHDTKSNEFDTSYIYIYSESICNDLYKYFNITPNKSSTLLPPNLSITNLIDSYIIGLIDGDGSIGETNNRLYISITGTKEVLQFVKNRFEEILEKPTSNLHCVNEASNNYTLRISDLAARKIYNHLMQYIVPRLERKWKYTNLSSDRKPRKRNMEKYYKVKELSDLGFSQIEIANRLGCSPAAISWIKKQNVYRELDKGETNIEDEA